MFSRLPRRAARHVLVSSLALALMLVVLVAPLALAAPGYELSSVKPSISTDLEIPLGVAIDQESQHLYVTELISDFISGAPGQIEQFDASGVPTANSPFNSGASDYFAAVAVNPLDHSVYTYQIELETPFGTRGEAQMNIFSSTGESKGMFTPVTAKAPRMTTDSAGRVYLPNRGTGTVQVFNSAGVLQDSIACTGCPGGAFTDPGGVAIDSTGRLYVVDRANGGRVIAFKPSAGSYVYDSVLQSGLGAAAIGVDPVSNDVLVGVFSGNYRIIAYDSSGNQIDDFGEGVLATPFADALGAGQIAVSATTRKAYIADSGDNKVWIFDRVASIPLPTVSTDPANPVGQLDAKLNSSINPHGHRLTECEFKYTDHADFVANGLANADIEPCSFLLGGSTAISMPAQISGLTPNTEYHYRVVAASNAGKAEGAVQTFSTLPPLPPLMTAGSPSSITLTTATLAASVNPRGGVISDCHFEYIKEQSFQANGFTGATSASCAPKKPSGSNGVPVTAKLTGLAPGTAYRFRILATNNSGSGNPSESSFSTLAETCATNPTLCPPSGETGGARGTSPPPTSTAIPPVAPIKPVACGKGFLTKKVGGSIKCTSQCRKGYKKKKVGGKPKCIKVRKPKRS